jgi:hypothetical protein
MTLQAQLAATITSGPASVTDQQFPSGVNTISFGFNPPQKQYAVATGAVVTVNSPSAPVAIEAIGSGGQVTQGLTLYMRALTPLTLVATITNPAGGTFTSTIPLGGACILELPSNAPLIGLTVQGAGTLEYWCSGTQ